MNEVGFPYDSLVASISAVDLLSALVVLVAALLAVGVIRRGSVSIRKANINTAASCGACGWSGEVSIYAPRCPSCGERLTR